MVTHPQMGQELNEPKCRCYIQVVFFFELQTNRSDCQSKSAAMGRKVIPNTADASCNTDLEAQSAWPWSKKTSESVETNYRDLQRAEEKQQACDDEQYIANYYQRQAQKRRRHRENQKEALWQAEERLSMSRNDYDIPGTIVKKQNIANLLDAEVTVSDAVETSAVETSATDTCGTCVDKRPLRDALWSVAADMDSNHNTKKRRAVECFGTGESENPTSSGSSASIRLHGWFALDNLWPTAQYVQPPADVTPQQLIPKSFPKSRTFGHSRISPRLNKEAKRGDTPDIRPPYGLQLLDSYFNRITTPAA